MELTGEIKLDVASQCINGYEWPSELLSQANSLKSLEGKLDYEEFFRITKSFKNSIPVVVTLLSKEYLSVGKVWLSMLKRTSVEQYIIIAADEESKTFLDSINEPNCRVCLGKFTQNENPFLSKTGFTEKGLSITALKFPIVKELLQLNFDVLLMDIDALLLTDLPLDFFSTVDIAFQRVFYFPKPIARVWNFAACSGFVWFKSTSNTIQLLNMAIERQEKVYSDQIALNIALWESDIKWEYPQNKKKDYQAVAKSEGKDFFIQNHKNKIHGVSEESGLKVCALPTDSFWRNDFVPLEISNVIVFHPNSPKVEEGKLEVYENYKLLQQIPMNETILHSKIKELLKYKEFIEAIELLEKFQFHSSFSIKHLSLLYRFYGQLEKEIILFHENKTFAFTDPYLIERRKELDRKQIELLVPRKILNTSTTFSDSIKKNIVSKRKLCFVVPSNDEYFGLLTECLSSILSCDEFEACPIFIANCGLNSSNILTLKNFNSRITVVEIDEILSKYEIALSQKEKYLSALLFRGFFDELFSDFEYCFYMDSDAWIQDQSCIYDYIDLATNQGIALPKHPFNVNVSKTNHWLNRGTLTQSQEELVIGFPAIINCCICVRIKSKEYSDYKETLIKNATTLGANWGIDQEVFLYIAAKYKLKLLPNEYAYEGAINLKIEDDGSHVLYSNMNELIKIFHLGGGLKFKNRKWDYFTDADWVYQEDKKIKLKTSTHFCVPEWRNRNWLHNELTGIENK